MIRLAFVAVLMLAGVLTFSAFYLAKGSEGQPTEITTGTPDGPSPAAQAPDTPEVEKLFFLRGIDFEIGEITLVLFQAGADHERLIIRDQAALLDAQDKAYINTTTPSGEEAGSLLLNMMGAPSEETVAQIYRDDVLIAAVSCASSACGQFADGSDVNYAGLTEFGVPHQTINDEFSTYEAYIATIEGIADDPNYMLLDQRPLVDFPLAQRPAHLIVELPNVITNDASFEPGLHEALVQTAIVPLLPEGANLDWVQVTEQGPAVLADKDNNQPVLAGGTPIVFNDARFYSVRARINGVTTLPTDVYNALTQASMRQIDIDAAFPAFVASRLQTDCIDCYFLKVEGDYSAEAHAFDWRSEAYYLNYYDLREAP